MHTALEPIVKLSLSTTTSKNLRLYYKSVMSYEMCLPETPEQKQNLTHQNFWQRQKIPVEILLQRSWV